MWLLMQYKYFCAGKGSRYKAQGTSKGTRLKAQERFNEQATRKLQETSSREVQSRSLSGQGPRDSIRQGTRGFMMIKPKLDTYNSFIPDNSLKFVEFVYGKV